MANSKVNLLHDEQIHNLICGAILFSLRFEQGIEQKLFADKIGVSQASISRFESGSAPISLYRFRLLCDELDVDLLEINDWIERISKLPSILKLVEDHGPDLSDYLGTRALRSLITFETSLLLKKAGTDA